MQICVTGRWQFSVDYDSIVQVIGLVTVVCHTACLWAVPGIAFQVML